MEKYLLKFISKNSIKPEITHVYKNCGKAVATDSFKLLEINLEESFSEIFPDGYYTKEEWKTMSDMKKKDQWEAIAKAPRPKLDAYPDYTKIIPKGTDLEAYKGKLAFNIKYLNDFLEARNESERLAGRTYQKELCFNPDVLLENKGIMLAHINENSTILLMGVNSCRS